MLKPVGTTGLQLVQPHRKPRFGCRLFAYITEQPDASQPKLLRDCLISSPLSLRRRSMLPSPQARQISLGGWVGKPEHADGWGIAAYRDEPQHPFKIEKSALPAGADRQFSKSVKAFIRFQPRVMLAHIRGGGNPIVENAHPFVHNQWTFMHNGFVDGVTKPAIQGNIQKHFPAAVKGTTDTEQLFYHFLGKLRESGKPTDTGTMPGLQNVVDNFVQAVLEAKDGSTSQKMQTADYFEKRTGIPLTLGSQISTGQAANVVASDGQILMATKTGRSLYLGTRTNDSGFREVMVASEEIPTKLPRNNVTWWEIPDNHLLAVWPDAKKRLQIMLTPFEHYQETLSAMTPKI